MKELQKRLRRLSWPRRRVSVTSGGCLSPRDYVMVARHEMPGKMAPRPRPVGYGMVGGGQVFSTVQNKRTPLGNLSYRALRGGAYLDLYQAFRAWLPSIHPSGTKSAP